MKIVIPGGSGQVGTVLAEAFHADGHEVVVLSRQPTARPWRTVKWDGRTVGDWTREIDGADVVVNLAGRSVNCRYNLANRNEMLQSRVESTRIVGEAIAQAKRPPRVWLQASTATFYAQRYDGPNDERGVIGGAEPDMPDAWRFSIGIIHAWERAFNEANTPATRKVTMRTAMVIGPGQGGIFDTLATLVRRGLGGTIGSGRQYMSWIHYEDLISAIRWLIDRDDIDGVVNLASPNPVPNADFMRQLREACGMSFGLPTKKLMLEIGAIFMRTEPELVLKSRRVVPGRLLENGFVFKYPQWSGAAKQLYGKWTMRRGAAVSSAA